MVLNQEEANAFELLLFTGDLMKQLIDGQVKGESALGRHWDCVAEKVRSVLVNQGRQG